jgi:hypothetical protein
LLTVSKVYITSADKPLSSSLVKTYFAKGWFTLSKVSDTNGVLTIKLTNTSDKTVKITGLSVDNNGTADDTRVASASINNQTVTIAD